MQKVRSVPFYGVIALLAYMPFHVFLVQYLSTLTGGLNIWKVAVDVVILVLTVLTTYLVFRQGSVPRTFLVLFGLTVFYALFHLLLWATHPHIYKTSALIGIAYNVRVLCFAVIGYGAALLKSGGVKIHLLLQFVLVISSIVATLAIVQYLLPSNFLTHFGYSTARGARPAFFIDNNSSLLRVTATLRDPNSLGAYLVLPIGLLVYRLLSKADRRSRLRNAGLLFVQLAALGLTFSRSAWLAAALTIMSVVFWRYRAQTVRAFKRWWPAFLVLLVLLVAGTFAARHNSIVKSYVIHSTGKPQGQYDSDGFHWYFVKRGVEGIWHDPFGHGPGTAGLASIQNPSGGLLTENYYVQIGYELGIAGLALFLAANAYVYCKIRQRTDELKVILLASFWGYVVVNMLLHGWSNEAIAAQWWLLAGVAMAGDPQKSPGKTTKT